MTKRDDELKAAIEAEMGKPENLGVVIEDAAAGMVLAAWHELRAAGQETRYALGMAAYLVLTSVYGRDWCREHLGLPERTEREWYARVRATAEQLGDEPSAELLQLAISGGFAAQRNRRES